MCGSTPLWAYLISNTGSHSDRSSLFILHALPLCLNQQLRCQHLAPVTTCLVLQPTDCTAQCLNLSPSRSSSRLPRPAVACPPALSMALDQSPIRLRVVPFSHTPLLHHQAPPWASAVPVALLALAWALLLEALAPLVSDSATSYMTIK